MQLWRDLRFGLRSLSKSPGFTLISVLALALGIGPNTALFSVVYAAFFDSQGYPDADRVVSVGHVPKGSGSLRGIAPGDWLEYQARTTAFESLTASVSSGGRFGEGLGAEVLNGEKVTPGHLSKTLGLQPMLGRDFLPEEGEPGKDHVVILSYPFWESHFPKDENVVGRSLRLSGEPFTVVGVMPPTRSSRDRRYQGKQIWKPLGISPKEAQKHGSGEVLLTGRLKPGVTLEQARSNLNRIARDLSALYPASGLLPATRTTLWLLGGTVGFVLLIACANLASLMIARGTARRREMAIRMSLGASARQLFRQLLIETSLISSLGCAVGCALGWALLRLMVVQMPAVTQLADAEPQLSLPVLLFTAGIAIVAGVVFGSVPLWRASSQYMDEALKAGTQSAAGRSRVRLRRALVVFEFAAAMTLLAAAAICTNSLWQKTREEIGFPTMDRVLVFGLLPPLRVNVNDPIRRDAFYNEAIDTIRAMPGVQHAARLYASPLLTTGAMPFEIAGQPAANKNARPRVAAFSVSGAYFDTLGIQILGGRAIEDEDGRDSEQIAMVNEEFARRYLHNTNPLGQYLSVEQLSAKGIVPVQRKIVGVFQTLARGDVRFSPGASKRQPEIAVPASAGDFGFLMVVRTVGDPMELRGAIAQAMLTLNPDFAIRDVATLDQMAFDLAARERGYAVIFGLLAGLALLLSGVGIYGAMAFLVAQRTKEIGVRMALGASRQRVVRMIFSEGMLLAAVGLGIGLMGATSVSSALQSVLFENKPLPYGVFAGAAIELLLSASVACGLPALRASEVDPVNALRSE